MSQSLPYIIYIHGFNSSPASEKAQQFRQFCQAREKFNVFVPALSHDPRAAVALLEALITEQGEPPFLIIGSSLGGYYATWLAEKYGCRAALVNPAVSPVKHLGEEFLGPQKNLYTGEEYEFTREHAGYLDTLDVDVLANPANYLLLVQTADEVLDYRLAVAHYAGAVQIVQEGGSHSFRNFSAMLPLIMAFAEHGSVSATDVDTARNIAIN